MKKFPKLFALSSTGKIKTWMIEAAGNNMIESWGYIDGKIQSQSKVVRGKNIGRANETSDEEQCISECQSKWQKKVDEQYATSLDDVKDYDVQDILLPMLALKYTERKHDITFPCYVQPKLNGVRCVFQNGKFISRGGKEYTTLEHLREEVELLGINNPDGEIYIHGPSLQNISSRVKEDKGDATKELEYWIYDQAIDTDFDRRNDNIKHAFGKQKFEKLKYVDTFLVSSEEDIDKWHKKFVQDGFEGIIIRNRMGTYKYRVRSKDLQKLKNFIDEEFVITGGKEATGNDAGTVVFECKTKDGEPFSVRPRGTRAVRSQWFKELKSLIGKKLTVRYQELTDDGKPEFPVGIVIRDYE